jgi:hypothetical protein
MPTMATKGSNKSTISVLGLNVMRDAANNTLR